MRKSKRLRRAHSEEQAERRPSASAARVPRRGRWDVVMTVIVIVILDLSDDVDDV